MSTDYTDQVYQEVKLFIEGIQVPYLNISIRQSYQTLPSASVEIPSLIGLETIDKFYNPKVHIFTVDPISLEEILLFQGLIMGHQYQKETSGQGNKSTIYHCDHPYKLLEQLTLYYSSFSNSGSILPSQKDAVDRQYLGSLSLFMVEALTGLNQGVGGGFHIPGTKEALKPTPDSWGELPLFLDDNTYKNRLAGIPGVLLKMWNILKTNSGEAKNPMLNDLYIPLIEGGLISSPGTGIDFFKRISGISFLEKGVDQNRVKVSFSDNEKKGKKGATSKKYNVLVPPIFHSFSDQVMTSLIPKAMRFIAQAADEYTNFWNIIKRFLQFIDYEFSCLASPSQTDSNHQAIDFIVKPQTPFYYSPLCNVIFPNMYDSLSIQDETGSTPTRMLGDLNKNFISSGHPLVEVYRSPPSVRNAVKNQEGGDLAGTLSLPSNAIGPFEYGRGVRAKSIILPDWVYVLEGSSTVGDVESDQLIFSTLDVEYYKNLAGSRTGEVSGAFNPYIVPGFPMDVLDEDHLAPSYHGLCTSVTHSITPESIRTQIGFTSILSYDELGSYKLPPNYPWLDDELGTKSGEWVNVSSNSKVKKSGDEFYKGLFNQKAVDPGDIYDFTHHRVKPIQRSSDNNASYEAGSKESNKDSNGLETNPWLSYKGNLQTCYRPIETLSTIEKHKNITFVPFEKQAKGSAEVPYIETSGYKNQKEFGQNLFLDYSKQN